MNSFLSAIMFDQSSATWWRGWGGKRTLGAAVDKQRALLHELARDLGELGELVRHDVWDFVCVVWV